MSNGTAGDHGARLAQAAREICARLSGAGHRALLVGGCVRDRLMGLPLKDIDIATDASAAQMKALFPQARTVGAAFGVLLVPQDGLTFEVATFRREGQYADHRHPLLVEAGTLEEDARRRDFTANALYEDPATGEVIDLVGGRADLEARVLRCVGDPAARFDEDALRLLRLARFAARLGFEIDPATLAAAKAASHTITWISAERVRDELTAMLTGPAPARALRLLHETGVLEYVLPEVAALRGVEQGRLHHPEGDVWEHTLLCLEKLEPRTPRTAWATLLHDIGKPATFARTPEGTITFYEHQNVGADIAAGIMARLKFANADIEHIAAMVRRHMMFMSVQRMKASTFRRFISAPTIHDDLALHRADVLGSNGRLDHYLHVKARMAELAAGGTAAVPRPLVNGDDLKAMGLAPSPRMGEVLRRLHDMQLEGEFADREAALARARELVAANATENP
jgi:poly(A) polymerase